ncbi:MAG: hypothetical protein EOP09_06845 [Proteobacteria bacterium]|nr:MAG: hypothetical protein EOP09_06845 [Pseudomonadota bacterium]
MMKNFCLVPVHKLSVLLALPLAAASVSAQAIPTQAVHSQSVSYKCEGTFIEFVPVLVREVKGSKLLSEQVLNPQFYQGDLKALSMNHSIAWGDYKKSEYVKKIETPIQFRFSYDARTPDSVLLFQSPQGEMKPGQWTIKIPSQDRRNPGAVFRLGLFGGYRGHALDFLPSLSGIGFSTENFNASGDESTELSLRGPIQELGISKSLSGKIQSPDDRGWQMARADLNCVLE